MTDINLLPWREARREKEKKEFNAYLALAVALAAFIVFLMNLYANSMITEQTSRNAILENEIKLLDKQLVEIKKLKELRQALITRMTIVQNLQATRTLTVRMFDELIRVLPDGVFLTQIEREGNKITLYGYAEANSNISELMRQIENNQWIKKPELTEIKKAEESESIKDKTFKLSFTLGSKIKGSLL